MTVTIDVEGCRSCPMGRVGRRDEADWWERVSCEILGHDHDTLWILGHDHDDTLWDECPLRKQNVVIKLRLKR